MNHATSSGGWRVKPRAPSTAPRVLLCTAYRRFRSDYLDYVGQNVYSKVRVSLKRTASPGLRFLKQNVPEIEILEYPMWRDYVKKLGEGWDVVGFSFFESEIGEVIKMAEEARRQGIKELWAGCYGALNPVIPKTVDRVFYGAAEDEMAQVFGKRVKDIEHPVVMWPMTFMPGNIPHFQTGLLYTQHGCPYKCTFCQTPVFDTGRETVNLDSIERVLRYYAKNGVSDVLILDELFGFKPQAADKITNMLARYKLRWWSQTRAAIFLRHLDEWYERGLRFPLIGVETMSQQAMDDINKKQKIEDIREFIRRTGSKPGMYRMAYYMIGYEHETVESTLKDVMRLKKIGFDAHQVNVLTPFPKTPMWDEIESRYGIFDHTYRHYDAKYMVWNHPHISAARMHYLLPTVISILNRPLDIYGRQFTRLIRDRFRARGLDFIWRDLIKSPIAAALTNDRKQVFFPKLGEKETRG
ncbi:MAG: radical SAM protein [candidate division WOR-3 bacterium]|nr:radical SAM protein [candidate division WOR-3 bacterium]